MIDQQEQPPSIKCKQDAMVTLLALFTGVSRATIRWSKPNKAVAPRTYCVDRHTFNPDSSHPYVI